MICPKKFKVMILISFIKTKYTLQIRNNNYKAFMKIFLYQKIQLILKKICKKQAYFRCLNYLKKLRKDFNNNCKFRYILIKKFYAKFLKMLNLMIQKN